MTVEEYIDLLISSATRMNATTLSVTFDHVQFSDWDVKIILQKRNSKEAETEWTSGKCKHCGKDYKYTNCEEDPGICSGCY